ncbi:class A sortase [Peptostreptococcus porci]|uniref:class A sortase n=1 Tax=Peptostreptococcus porci TaxID=2652282 RepID=UPI002A90BE9E|nr:class A sortase [Peptostreptococcus porci]MDY5435982.1 class A sortase [Peptostreptococcus porci]
MSRRQRKLKESKNKINIRLTLGIIFLLVAICLLLVKPLKSHLLNENISEYESNKSKILSNASKNAKKEKKNISKGDYNFDKVERLNLQTVVNAKNKVNFDNASGAIAIPDINLSLPIFDALNNYNLAYGAGTMKENQVMGNGNYALAGHNYPDSPKILFSPLVKINQGNVIYLTDFSFIYIYNTLSITTIKPTQVDVINDTDGVTELTLITCNDDGSLRHMVKATYSGKIPVSEASQDMKNAFGYDFN